MMTRRILACSLAAAMAVGFANDIIYAHEITIGAIIRDFSVTHPDFEATVGNDVGYVATELGADGKPVYIGGAGTLTTSGAANYNHWYNDVEGVNKSAAYNLVLSNGQPGAGGVYTFDQSSFFPIDNQIFGNEGRAHNFHFTLEAHTAFVYQPGLTLEVRADDDLIIFINGQKVIDLGGIHSPLTSSLNVDNLGLIAGQTYDFDLFFAERHTSQSALKLSTNIQFVPEPATMALMVFSGIAMILRGRRRVI